MKIAVASDDKVNISHHFGKAIGFSVFEIKDGKIIHEEYRENIGKNKGECGTCDHGAMINNIKDCDSVISYGMGQKIFNDLTNNNIKAIVTEENSVKEAVDKFIHETLKNRTDKLH
ncbi:MAG: NifB/NifX family molybdenum-iron cluster-binding protein [Candidatus Woesearchaeota archaeon]|jgi:predicted Fe-Mo cluster-binding NifX family protein